jgi:hypothetical protein
MNVLDLPWYIVLVGFILRRISPRLGEKPSYGSVREAKDVYSITLANIWTDLKILPDMRFRWWLRNKFLVGYQTSVINKAKALEDIERLTGSEITIITVPKGGEE